jgi:hypothetical protein
MRISVRENKDLRQGVNGSVVEYSGTTTFTGATPLTHFAGSLFPRDAILYSGELPKVFF